MGGRVEEVRSAIRLLMGDDRVVKPDALPILKAASDPEKLAKKILEKTPSGTLVNAELINALQTPNIVKPKPKPIANSGSALKPVGKPQTKPIQQVITNPVSSMKPKSRTILPEAKELTGLHNYESDLQVVFNPPLSQNMVGDLDDMVGYFQDRYKKLSRMLKSRNYITNLREIGSLPSEQREINVIGMVTEKSFSSENSGHIVLEDPKTEKTLTAQISDPVLVEKAQQLMNDTVVCLLGSMYNDRFFTQEIYLPDVVNSKPSKADVPVHAAFLSDIHVGSKGFLSEPMENFIDFLNGEYGNKKMRLLGSMTKYVMFAGDVVDGIGIYPNQQDDLALDSIGDQYNEFARFVDRIPEDVEVVIIPGNHDMVRSAEPQPIISPQYAPDLHNFKNVHMLPNPSQVSLHGVKTLLYHCTSLPDIINHLPGLNIEKPVEVMKHMLKARHLAPLWGEKTPLATEPEDYLVIDPIPDIFHGGHVHINDLGTYNGVKIVNSGTMQEQTSFQRSLNIDPTPGIVQLINLQTYKPSSMDFMTK
ncbi:MAG: DNA-directed DNA polymerase II small subunit [Candidatus Kariarchaeaceae archaeon]|jgi:DNA polymerase II small subunit